MLEGFFHKITIWEYVKKASAYIREKYSPKEEFDSNIRYSDRGVPGEHQGIKRQIRSNQSGEGKENFFDFDKFSTSSNEFEAPKVAPSVPKVEHDYDLNIRYDLAFDDELENRYDEARIAAAMKKYSFLDESITLFDALDRATNKTFVDALMIHMRRRDLKPSSVYNAANIDRKLFSKIISDRNYKPSKDTAIAIILALHLTLDEANDMLERAGYAFSHSNKKDIIIEYFIRERIYNINDINEVLYKLDQKIIGK